MKLYYFPGACSLAAHIALEEAGLAYELAKVDLTGSRKVDDGEDFASVNPKGYVPALRLDDGSVLTENIAILSYLADRADDFAPPPGMRRYRLLETLAFISTEIHKGFTPFFRGGSDQEKQAASETLAKRFATIADTLGQGEFICGEQLTVADFYLFVVLSWARKFSLEVPAALTSYYDRLKARPAFAKAMADEGIG